jgi:hypothetical protein
MLFIHNTGASGANATVSTTVNTTSSGYIAPGAVKSVHLSLHAECVA